MSTKVQKLVWVTWVVDSAKFLKGSFAQIDLPEKPTRIWTLYQDRDEHNPPVLPFVPVHNVNAFLEDYVHDWNWENGRLRYFTRIMNRSCWLLLEYEAKP